MIFKKGAGETPVQHLETKILNNNLKISNYSPSRREFSSTLYMR